MIKIQGGTAKGWEDLCATCRSAHRMKGQGESSERTYCYMMGKFIPFPLASCSSYEDRRQPSVEEMKKIAWTLRTSASGNAIGFKAPVKNVDYTEQTSPIGPGFASTLVNIE